MKITINRFNNINPLGSESNKYKGCIGSGAQGTTVRKSKEPGDDYVTEYKAGLVALNAGHNDYYYENDDVFLIPCCSDGGKYRETEGESGTIQIAVAAAFSGEDATKDNMDKELNRIFNEMPYKSTYVIIETKKHPIIVGKQYGKPVQSTHIIGLVNWEDFPKEKSYTKDMITGRLPNKVPVKAKGAYSGNTGNK